MEIDKNENIVGEKGVKDDNNSLISVMKQKILHGKVLLTPTQCKVFLG